MPKRTPEEVQRSIDCPWFSIPEVAIALEISVDMARKLVNAGHFEVRKFPGCQVRVSAESVQEFLDATTFPPER